MKKLLFIFSFFLIIHTMNGQAALNNRVTVRNQGNVDNYTGVKQVLISVPADQVDRIYNGSTLVFDTITGLFTLALPSGSESGGGFFTSSTSTGATVQDCDGQDFELSNFSGLNITSTNEGSTIDMRAAIGFTISSADSLYQFIRPPSIDTGATDYRLGYSSGTNKWWSVPEPAKDVYVSTITQSGTGEPSLSVLDQFTGGAVSISRDDVGFYTIVVPGFDYATEQSNLVAFLSPGLSSAPVWQIAPVDIFGPGDDGLLLQTFNALGVATDIEGTYTIEIRLYK